MRLPAVLSRLDLPEPELHAAALDGELLPIGGAFCPTDSIPCADLRAASVAAEAGPRAIAEQLTAAWIYGLLTSPPARLQLCVDATSGYRPLSTARQAFREVVIGPEDVLTLGGMPVTTPLRTAIDMARAPHANGAIILALSRLGRGFTLEDCTAVIETRRNLPHRNRAISVLTETFGPVAQVSPR